MFKKLISILKLCPKSGLKHSVDHAQVIGMKFKICFFRFFLVEIWFKNDISIKNMSCLTLNPTSVNNHNAQYAHKHAISTQRGVTTGETQREKNNGENDANCEISFCEQPGCYNGGDTTFWRTIWFPQWCKLRNVLLRFFYPCFAKNRHAQKYVLRKSGFPKDVFAKILDIQDRGLRKIRVRSFSKDVFIWLPHVLRKSWKTAMPKNMFCENAQKYVLRKSGFPKDVFAKILDIQDRGLRKIRVRSFSKDLQLLNYLLLHVRIYW